MKIRQGFVSNSSSSSFLMIGWVLDEEKLDNETYDNFRDIGLDIKYDENTGNYFVGKLISDTGSDECNINIISPQEMGDINNELVEKKSKTKSNLLRFKGGISIIAGVMYG